MSVKRFNAVQVMQTQLCAGYVIESGGKPEVVVLASDYDALSARCAELEANLLYYGAHMVACDFIQDTLKCSCGFEDIRKRLSATPGGKP